MPTCHQCRALRLSLQAIINELDCATDEEDATASNRHVYRARSLATEALLGAAGELSDDLEPLGRIELYTLDNTLLGETTWRYTNTIDTIAAEPFSILEDGEASHALVYMPNGTFAGRAPVGLLDSECPIRLPQTQLEEGRIINFPNLTLKHDTQPKACPNCGYVMS
jgi:hypothetical protein